MSKLTDFSDSQNILLLTIKKKKKKKKTFIIDLYSEHLKLYKYIKILCKTKLLFLWKVKSTYVS